MPPTRSFHCVNHPQREGIGICVGCRQVVCVECSTKVDRMNYCRRCLQSAAMAAAPTGDNAARETALGIPMLVVWIAAAGLTFYALGYLLALIRSFSAGGVSPS